MSYVKDIPVYNTNMDVFHNADIFESYTDSLLVLSEIKPKIFRVWLPTFLLEALPLEEGESSQHQPSSDPKPARKKRVEKPRNPRFNDQENRALVTGILEHYDSIYGHLVGRTSAASKKEMWDTIVIGVNACGNSVRDKYHCRKRFDDIRSKLKKKIQDQRVHATGTGGGPTPQRLILTPLEELLRPKLLTVVVEGLAGDRDIGIYPSQFPAVAPGGHVSPEMEQVSSPGSASSTLLEEHHGDEDDEYDEDDATEETEIQSCDHEEVPIETVVPPNRPSTSTYDAIVASEGKIVDAENRRHSDMMTVLERMIGLQEETVSQLAHLHRVFIEVPKQLQKINTSFEALVVQQTQANYWRMTNVPQFNTSQPGSVHAGQFSPHSSEIHSPGPNVTGQVADIAVQVPDDILPLPSLQIQQQTPTKEATKTKQDTHETDQPSLVQCLPTCSHVSLGTSPVREQSLPKSPVGESLPKSPVGESLPKSPVGESLPTSPVAPVYLDGDGRPFVKCLLEGQDTEFVIDTGAQLSVTRQKLPVLPQAPICTIVGFNGHGSTAATLVTDISLEIPG
ncbi:uncharacterized protein LOC142494327 [Ascaphus truei]|uniref:uncharacterized protein LOC142494327 n=1 Tax=Ascaphus truei TaxID=8439 RepID=UPI003F5AB4DC